MPPVPAARVEALPGMTEASGGYRAAPPDGYRWGKGTMASVERTITVSQPIAQVWAYLSDFTTTQEWDPPTVSTVRQSGDREGVGTTYLNVSEFLGYETETQ